MVFFITNGTALSKKWWDATEWRGCLFDGNFLYDPISIEHGNGDASLFVVGLGHDLQYKFYHDGSGSALTSFGGHLITPPAVVLRGTVVDVFYVGKDHAIYHLTCKGPTTDPYHARLDGGRFTHVPTAVSWGSDHMALFAVGLDSALYYAHWSSRFGWYPFEKLDGKWIGTPKAVSDKPGNIDVFGISDMCTLNHISYSYSAWSPVRSMDGIWHSTPEAISWGPGRIDVFAAGFDSATYHCYWDGTWSGWSSLGGIATHPPKAVSCGEGHISLFCIAKEGNLVHMCLNKEGGVHTWRDPSTGLIRSGWEDLGGCSTSRAG